MTTANSQFWKAIASQINTHLNLAIQITCISPVSGGDINQAFVVSDEKHAFFVKVNHVNKLPLFAAELLALEEINKTQTIEVPQAYFCGQYEDKSFLVMEKLSFSHGGSPESLARNLAQMHQFTAKHFGWQEDNFIGSTEQRNLWSESWPTFFSENRLGFQMRLLRDNGASQKLRNNIRIIQQNIEGFFIGYQPKPSLVHGDLWQGNYGYLQSGRPVIYDPASYYADFEVDLAMMELFGNPGDVFFNAYQQQNQIHSGYSLRKNLYNLYHILNHANLFGGGYASQAESMSDRLIKAV